MTCILRFVIMGPVGGAAWKTEEEVAAHMKTEEHMENHRKEDRQTIIRQEDRELRRSVRVCGGEEKDNA